MLWAQGPSTVREVQAGLGKEVGYTTVLKLLQIMTDKGLVSRDQAQRTHVYKARRSEGETQRQLVGDLMERAFGGSASRLVMQALSAQRASEQELAEIRRLLDTLEEES